MANTQSAAIKKERIAAYNTIVNLFPSATDMSRELSLDNRATVSQWKQRGVPIEYIMLLDILGLVTKEMLVPSVQNWDLLLSKHEQVIQNKLKKVLLTDSLKKTATTTLQAILAPVIEERVRFELAELGIIEIEEEEPEEDLGPDEDDIL